MILQRLVFALVATLAMIQTANAQERQPIRGQLIAGPPLITADGIEKLKLTAEQKDKFGKIEAEYKEKIKSAPEELLNSIKDIGKDREKIKELLEKLQGGTKKLREEALTKVAAILTAEQKTVLAQLKDEQPRRPGIGVRPGLPIVGGGGAGQIIPPGVQSRLQLTDEQKKQIEAIQKDAETKALKVLTDEQRKQYEEFKKNSVRPGVRPVQGVPDLRRLVDPNRPANPDVKKD